MSERFQNKLLNHEVTPPPGIWEKIAGTLDGSGRESAYPAKLYDLEIAPPLAAWENIKASLADGQPVIGEKRKRGLLLRYAAVAAAIGFIAWGSSQLLGKKSGTGKIVKQELLQPVQEASNTIAKKNESYTNDHTAPDTDEVRNDAALEESKKTYAKLDMAAGNRIKKVTDNYLTAADPGNDPNEETYNELHYTGAVGSAVHNYEMTTNSPTDRYITLMTPEGNIIRMSKKLSALVCCVSGEEQDEDCKDQMKDWRKKIACSSIPSSPDNFLDILNLVSSLQENY